MKHLARLRSHTFFPVLLLSTIITLLSFPLISSNDFIEKEEIKNNLVVIKEWETVGDYASALTLAKKNYKGLQKAGLLAEATQLSRAIVCLEDEVLKLGFSMLLFDQNFQPRQKLLELLNILGMPTLREEESPLVQINSWAQKNLLRQGERWEAQTQRFDELKPKIMPLLSDLGFVKEVFPHFMHYEGALVHGALLPRVRLRLYDLVEQWKSGVRFTHLYFLSGARPLDVIQENKEALLNDNDCLLKMRKDGPEHVTLPKTECEMMQWVWDQSEIPNDMLQQVKLHLINSPMKNEGGSDKLIRPNTEDTIRTWLETNPPRGRYLAITNAPYTIRQDYIVRTITSTEYGFDTVGFGASENEKVFIFLDELARCIFLINQTMKNKQS